MKCLSFLLTISNLAARSAFFVSAIFVGSLTALAPIANASTFTYDVSLNIAPVTITGTITTNCDNCGLTNLNILSWAFNSSSGESVTSATVGANISFGGSSVLTATPSVLNFTTSAVGTTSFNGPVGTLAVQFTTSNPLFPQCSTSTACEIAFLLNGVTDITLTGDQQVGTLESPIATPLPGSFPLFASGLGALSLLGWRRKKRSVQATA